MTANAVMEVGEGENGRHVELCLHETLRITLSEVRTAGFRWNLRTPEKHVLSLIEDSTEAAVGGSGGTAVRHWIFRAEEPGVATIVLEYSRPWERGAAPARAFSLSARVT